MTRILLAGDTHHDNQHIPYIFKAAKEYDCDLIIQLGDFGWNPLNAYSIQFISKTSFLATRTGIPLWWLDGNHENFDDLYTYTDINGDAPVELKPNLFYLPRGCSFTLGGVKFVVLGGAFSVDRDWSLKQEKLWKKPRHLVWYPDELTGEGDVDTAIKNGQGAQVMLTHDAPVCVDITAITNSKLNIPADLLQESLENRERIQRAVDAIRPQRLYHGHFHRAHTQYITDGDYTLRVEGLGCNGMDKRSWTILDTEDLH